MDVYYGSYRPKHFKFGVMTLREDRARRMDNIEDLAPTRSIIHEDVTTEAVGTV